MGSRKGRLHGALCEFFEIDKRQSSVATEIRAGITTFLTMSYILLVNPQILAQVCRGGRQADRMALLFGMQAYSFLPEDDSCIITFELWNTHTYTHELVSLSRFPPFACAHI